MTELPTTAMSWTYRLVEKLGFPIALILLAWFRLLEPAVQKHFESLEDERKARQAVVDAAAVQTGILKNQTELLSAIRADASETAAWTRLRAATDREQLDTLKKIERRDGM